MWLIAILVIAVAVDIGHAHKHQPAANATNTYSPPLTPAFTMPSTPVTTARPVSQETSAPPVPPTSAAVIPTGYPGAQVGDQPAATNGSATVHGVQVQASGWVRMTIDGYQRAVCVTAHIVNGTASQITYAPEDWSYQSPTGDVHQPTPIIYDPGTAGTLPPSLQYGQLIPGGSTTGRVCFDDPGTHGTYVASYRPEITAGGRAIWLIGE